MDFPEKINWEIQGARFLGRNLIASNQISNMIGMESDQMKFGPASSSDIYSVNSLHRKLRDGDSLNFWRKLLYKAVGKKLIATISDKDGYLVAFEMFYFKEEELNDKLIHEAFIGVDLRYRGQGLATKLRSYAVQNLSKSNLRAITTNISRTNIPSLKSAQRAGFEISSRHSKDDTYYLFRTLK